MPSSVAIAIWLMAPGIAIARTDIRSLEHFPEKWTPVFRRKCDQLKKLERVSDST
jgi:hypothetical protein